MVFLLIYLKQTYIGTENNNIQETIFININDMSIYLPQLKVNLDTLSAE